VIGVGQYALDETAHAAEVGFAVRDDYQNKGSARNCSPTHPPCKKQGLLGFFADVLVENRAMLHLFDKMGFAIEKRRRKGSMN